ncbi:MAG TPA: sugar phosphate isomerase/epimerase family protein [Candidatus Paceibacterota bacterium]|nr:sugar phosphate isomerase/epimerase [Verrucomicrobiota bacterium]HOX02464.1 sugar phosphate isomerase/epimerase family protein [Verrucomicrobiota bacterium]HRZ44898.1 sugar phosphate isomerase/epimerase family protein [Candidatus Paceibacterota bacterium]HRZ91518.1 sugar phosphate isomerase/epimerase family protein [Candidatus Paceibacterota bacterium]
MQKCGNKWPIGVCSWSFQKGVDEIGTAMAAMGLEHINLAIAPALGRDGDAYLEAVKRQGWTITAGMMNYDYEDYSTLDTIKATGGIAPDAHWPESGKAFAKAAKLTAQLGSKYILMHVGFLDHSNHAYAKKFYDRVRFLGDSAGEAGVTLLMETGQETAEELQRFVETLNHPSVLLNFDPANLILYNKDEPLTAFRRLSPWVRHIHIKDAIRTKKPGTWGAEVVWGEGQVNSFAFLNVLAECGYDGAVVIEREAGTQRVKDIATATRRLMAY